MKFEIKSKVMQFGNVYAIPIDFDFCMRTGLTLGSEVLIRAEALGHFTMDLVDMNAGTLCAVCGNNTAFNKCVVCGRFVCDDCFVQQMGMCTDCLKNYR